MTIRGAQGNSVQTERGMTGIVNAGSVSFRLFRLFRTAEKVYANLIIRLHGGLLLARNIRNNRIEKTVKMV